jgi:hypothetical protein
MLNINCKPVKMLTAAAAMALVFGCSKKSASDQTAAGAIDSATSSASSGTTLSTVTPAVGPGVQVTRTDAKSVTKSLDYELTTANFSKFLAAADSVGALEARDTTTRSYLSKNITDAGATDVDAGLKWLESNDSLSRVINSAGISVRDYYVASLATAAAARFLNDPKAAPESPALRKNADFLRSRQADLTHLQDLRDHKPVVRATP